MTFMTGNQKLMATDGVVGCEFRWSTGGLKGFVALEPCDLRKSFNGLEALVRERFAGDVRTRGMSRHNGSAPNTAVVAACGGEPPYRDRALIFERRL
jgi:hypothetical protein